MCRRFAFAGRRGARPGGLEMLRVGDGVGVGFRGAAGEVRFRRVTIGPDGGLAGVVCNRWSDGKGGAEEREGSYSLLPHVRKLTVRGNPQAVRDLAAYV